MVREPKTLTEAYSIASKFEQCIDKGAKHEENKMPRVNYAQSHRGKGEKNENFKSFEKKDKTQMKCFNCQGFGHKAYECKNKDKKEFYKKKKNNIKCFNFQRPGHKSAECRSPQKNKAYISVANNSGEENDINNYAKNKAKQEAKREERVYVCENYQLILEDIGVHFRL